jgi:hypothetical protein
LISSAMTFAARVGFDAGGEESPFWLHACRSGEGTAGVVGFTPVVRMRGVVGDASGAPFVLVGEVEGCCGGGEGDVTGARAVPFLLTPSTLGGTPFVVVSVFAAPGAGARCAVEDSTSSPTRRLFESVVVFGGESFRRVG